MAFAAFGIQKYILHTVESVPLAGSVPLTGSISQWINHFLNYHLHIPNIQLYTFHSLKELSCEILQLTNASIFWRLVIVKNQELHLYFKGYLKKNDFSNSFYEGDRYA